MSAILDYAIGHGWSVSYETITIFRHLLLFPGCSTVQKDRYYFGDNCKYQCHCLNGVKCLYENATCLKGCENGWASAGCQFSK